MHTVTQIWFFFCIFVFLVYNMFILFSCSIYKQVISYIEEGNLIYVYMYIFVFYFTILSCYSHTVFLFLYFILQYFHFILIQYSYTGDIVYHIRKSDICIYFIIYYPQIEVQKYDPALCISVLFIFILSFLSLNFLS